MLPYALLGVSKYLPCPWENRAMKEDYVTTFIYYKTMATLDLGGPSTTLMQKHNFSKNGGRCFQERP